MKTYHVNEISELYCHYSSQTSPQPCYVYLDCKNETLGANYNAEIGNAVPFSVWHGHTIRFEIPTLLASIANKLLDEIHPIAERVISGYTLVWDGNNFVAQFNEDATEAIEEIEKLCYVNYWDESDCVVACKAEDWASSGGTFLSIAKDLKITADSIDEEIDRAVKLLEFQASEAGIHVLEGTENYIRSIREELIDDRKENEED